jgi:hypothetical protein
MNQERSLMNDNTIFCIQCGARLQPQAQFCEACGQKVGEQPAPPPPAAQAGICAKCGLSDQTYTAADFVRQDFSQAKTKDDEWDPESTQLFLAKPEQPELPQLALWVLAPLIPILNAIMIWFAPLHKSYKFVMLALALLFIACVAVPSLYEFSAYAFVGIALLIVYYGGLIMDRGRHKAELAQKRLPAWTKMVAKWEQVRYCRRCDLAWLAFDPARQTPPENLEQLLGK